MMDTMSAALERKKRGKESKECDSSSIFHKTLLATFLFFLLKYHSSCLILILTLNTAFGKEIHHSSNQTKKMIGSKRHAVYPARSRSGLGLDLSMVYTHLLISSLRLTFPPSQPPSQSLPPLLNPLQTRLKLTPIPHNNHTPGIRQHFPHPLLLLRLIRARITDRLDISPERRGGA
jgi:hypothetical protein